MKEKALTQRRFAIGPAYVSQSQTGTLLSARNDPSMRQPPTVDPSPYTW